MCSSVAGKDILHLLELNKANSSISSNTNNKMCTRRGWSCALERWKPYIAMIALQFGYAGMNIITKVSLNRGMSHYVLVVYRHAIATVVIAPFAYFLERKIRPKLTFWTFCQIFALGLLGPVIDQNLYYAGLKFTSPTFTCAIGNVLPAMTFVMAALFRMEKVNIVERRSQAKIMGTLASAGGAMLMTLYKGPILHIPTHSHHSSSKTNESPSSTSAGSNDTRWIEGSLLLVASCLAWAGFFVLQAGVSKKYSSQLSLTTLICLMGTLESAVATFAVERDLSVWEFGWDMNLLTAVYSGVVASGIAYYVQGYVMEIKGPVFATAFTPLMMLIAAILGSIVLSESIYMGSVVGGVVIVAGLYAVLWGKLKEDNFTSKLVPKCEAKDANGDATVSSEEIIHINHGGENAIHHLPANSSIENRLHQANNVSVNSIVPPSQPHSHRTTPRQA